MLSAWIEEIWAVGDEAVNAVVAFAVKGHEFWKNRYGETAQARLRVA
jgi:hypothetical protein